MAPDAPTHPHAHGALALDVYRDTMEHACMDQIATRIKSRNHTIPLCSEISCSYMYESTCQLLCLLESIFSPVRPKMGEEGVQTLTCLCFFCDVSQETHDHGSKATESFTLSRERPFGGL